MNELRTKIKKLFFDVGVPVLERKYSESPNYVVIHYDLVDIEQLTLLNKKIKLVSAFIHKDIIYGKSDIAHFLIKVQVNNNDIVKFTDKKIQNIFNSDCLEYGDLVVGIDDENSVRFINLNDCPHILIAGTTGSGKSTALNSIICSILSNNKMPCIEFLMIDTKRVELSPYKKLKTSCKIVSELEDIVNALNDVEKTIDARYLIMEENGWKSIPQYIKRKIVVIEELGDLMSVGKKLIEPIIIKIARLGRACGVHLILVTQRPTVDVLTGEIKANIGCKLTLQTASAVDSRVILGHNGAEKLLGNGDCLLKIPTLSDEIHIKCPLITTENIEEIIKNH